MDVFKVLICDDSVFMRSVVSQIFKELSNEKHMFVPVAEAGNGLDAVTKYKEFLPDIVTMDITMPSFDGIYGVTEIVKYDPNAFVIMCSVMGQQSKIIEATQNGASDFIVKPFDKERIKKTLENFIKKNSE